MAIATQAPQTYLGNSNLKAAEVDIEYTVEQIAEIQKCLLDPVYFIETYVKIVHVDKGVIPMKLYPFQREMVKNYHNERKIVFLAPRQCGKTSFSAAYILYYILFNSNKTVAVLANKASAAREILARVKMSFEQLPKWLQQGVVTWNKGDIALENGSKVIAAATSSGGIRGQSISLLYLDEFAFVQQNIAEEFFASVYPTISSGQTTKVCITSTPQGFNFFYKMYTEAKSGINGFQAYHTTWDEVPGRDQAWLEAERKALGEQKFNQEVLCDFLGSSNTLLDSKTIRTLASVKPLKETDNLKVYEYPKPDHAYFITVDVAEGKEQDFSVANVIDITTWPFRQVAVYRNNKITPDLFPFVLDKLGKEYNEAFIQIETNSVGSQVVSVLNYDIEYENIFTSEKGELGVRTTPKTKRIGCFSLKSLIESQKFLVQDADTILELTNFVNHKATFRADAGYTDDSVMSLVNFAYSTTMTFFKDVTDKNYIDKLRQDREDRYDDLVPFGFFCDGTEDLDNDAELNSFIFGR